MQSEKGVFGGVGRKSDVDRYLAGAPIDKVTDMDTDPFTLSNERRSGTAKPKPPATQSFWVAKASGSTANLDWKVRDGDYRVVVMNADGTRGVATQTRFEVEIPHMATIAIVLLIVGLGTIGGGVALMAPSIGGSSTKPAAPAPTAYAVG